MKNSILLKLFGFRATLIHGDTLTLDRWLWLKTYLPNTNNNETLLDVGCGNGSFVIGASLRGYNSIGLSWDKDNYEKGIKRASICKAKLASFKIANVRDLNEQKQIGNFDVIINTENIEHILNDRKLFNDMYNLLKPGGQLLLTTPYLYYQPISISDKGPFAKIENGEHVRRGYNKEMLKELCYMTGFKVENISFCSGIISQKLCRIQRLITYNSYGKPKKLKKTWFLFGWSSILVFRILPPIFDKLMTGLFKKPYYSICLVAYKPRFTK